MIAGQTQLAFEKWWMGLILGNPPHAGRLLHGIDVAAIQDPEVRQIAEWVVGWEAEGVSWQFTDVLAKDHRLAADAMAWMAEALDVAPHSDHLVAQLQDQLFRSAVRAEIREVARTLDDPDADPLQGLTDAVDRLQPRRPGQEGLLDETAAVAAFLEWTEARANPERTPVLETPWPGLNRFGGGLAPEELIVVAARPGVGKTSLLLQLVAHLARRGVSVIVASYEMSPARCLAQVVGQVWGIDRYALSHGDLAAQDWDTIRRAGAEMAQWPLWWFPPRVTPDLALLTRAVLEKRPKMLVLDYLELVPLPGKRDKPQELGELAQRLKDLAIRANIPVVVAQQLDRAVDKEKRAPLLRDLRWSGGIEQAADKVWMLEVLNDGDRRCWIRKHRDGPLGVVDMAWDGPSSRLTERVDREEGRDHA